LNNHIRLLITYF